MCVGAPERLLRSDGSATKPLGRCVTTVAAKQRQPVSSDQPAMLTSQPAARVAQLPPVLQRVAHRPARGAPAATLKHGAVSSPTPPVPMQKVRIGHLAALLIRSPEISVRLIQRLIPVRQSEIRQHTHCRSTILAAEPRHLDPVIAEIAFVLPVPVETALPAASPAEYRSRHHIKRVANGYVGRYTFDRA